MPTLTQIVFKQIMQAVMCIAFSFCLTPVIAQTVHSAASHQFKEFNKELKEASINFSLPQGFKEIKAVNNEDFSFDYAIAIPGGDFEIWIQVRSEKENWASFVNSKNDKIKAVTNPDSLYADIGRAQAASFAGDNNFMERTIPQHALARYNADAGKTYIVNLPDLPVTKHFKYAMVVVLQKNHIGTILAVCLGNELGPGFFKYVNMANSCLKFNPS